LAVLHQQSGGFSADLLQLAPALLSSKPVQQQAHFGFGIPIPIPHLVATVIIVTALILVWLYQGSDEPAPVRRVEVPLQTKILTDNSEHKGVNQQGIVKRVIPGTLETITPKLDTADKLPLDKTMEKQAEARVIQPVEKPVAVKPLPTKTSLPKPANEQKQVVKTTKEPVVSKQEVAELKVSSPSVTPKNKSLSPREQRLMALAGTDYMLQLMGAVDEQRTERLVKRYAGRLPVTYFETRYKGKPWFVAIVGPYKSKELATQKLKLLPSELQKQSPWARSLASIQQDIRAKQP
jgi:DamX protein